MTDPRAALSPNTAVGVIGAGTMGRGIARVAAQAGHRVFLTDADRSAPGRAIGELEERLGRDVARGRISPEQAESTLARIEPVDSVEDVHGAGLVIEAIVERLDAKQELFAALDRIVAPDTILATNTSSLPVTPIASATSRPSHVAGMHFFNPAPVLPLVEVVAAPSTGDDVVETLRATATAWGKTPVVCTDTPGFIVNRIARPFYLEALAMLEHDDVEPHRIDAVFRGAGFRMGPFELLDLIGLDVNLAVSESVFDRLERDPRIRPSRLQRDLVATGRLGRKTGRGFYEHPPGPGSVAPHPPGPFAHVAVTGDLGHGTGLVTRLARTMDVQPTGSKGDRPAIVIDGHRIEPAPGSAGAPAMFDVVADWSTATAVAADGDSRTLDAFAGVCAAAGIDVIQAGLAPCGVVLRTVAMLVTLATEAAQAGVASKEDIDTAMRLGVNHPLGPFEWRDLIGDEVITESLRRLAATTDPLRYQPVRS